MAIVCVVAPQHLRQTQERMWNGIPDPKLDNFPWPHPGSPLVLKDPPANPVRNRPVEQRPLPGHNK